MVAGIAVEFVGRGAAAQVVACMPINIKVVLAVNWQTITVPVVLGGEIYGHQPLGRKHVRPCHRPGKSPYLAICHITCRPSPCPARSICLPPAFWPRRADTRLTTVAIVSPSTSKLPLASMAVAHSADVTGRSSSLSDLRLARNYRKEIG